MSRITFAATLLGLSIAACCLSGCQEGGAFFNQIERHVRNEGLRGNDFVTHLHLFTEQERAKPGDIKSQFLSAKDKEENRRTEMHNELARYTAREKETHPDFKVPETTMTDAERELMRRQFPDMGDY